MIISATLGLHLALLLSVRISEFIFIHRNFNKKPTQNCSFHGCIQRHLYKPKSVFARTGMLKLSYGQRMKVTVCNSSDNINNLYIKPENIVFNIKCLHRAKWSSPGNILLVGMNWFFSLSRKGGGGGGRGEKGKTRVNILQSSSENIFHRSPTFVYLWKELC